MQQKTGMERRASDSTVFQKPKNGFSNISASELLAKINESREGKKFMMIQKGPGLWVEKEIIDGKIDPIIQAQ